MSGLNFLLGNRDDSGFKLQGVVTFEAELTVSEQHDRKADVTEHPVETGAIISDHVILQPARVTLSGFVSDAGVAVGGAQPGNTQDAFDAIESAWESGDKMQVVSGYKTYSDMVITSVSLPKEKPGSMQFEIDLKHVTTVSSATGAIAPTGSPDSDATDDASAPEKQAGRQSTKSADDATSDKAESAAYESTLSTLF